MNIFICDDDKKVLESVKSMIEDIVSSKDKIYDFNDTDKLIKLMNKKIPDVLFMDIKLKNNNGIDFIKDNKLVLNKCNLVYITGYDEYIEDVFETEPIYLLRKPISKEKLEKVFNKINNKIKSENIILNVKNGKDLFKINTNDIVYIESMNRVLKIHLKDKTIMNTYNKLSSIMEELPDYFIQVHKSYIINMKKIKKYGSRSVILNDKTELKISRTYYKNVKENVLKYLGDSDE